MANKFIINDGVLIFGNVECHWELLDGRDREKTTGGGMWSYDRKVNTIYFFGESLEFGQVTKEQFNAAFKPSSVQHVRIVFGNEIELSELLKKLKINT